MAEDTRWGSVGVHHLSQVIRQEPEKVLIIDSRSFLEYNTCHIVEAVNVCCSKLVKRRLQQDKVSVKELLAQSCSSDLDEASEVIVYDQCTTNTNRLAADCFLVVLLNKLVRVFRKVFLLRGGFLEFQATHPSLCESKSTCTTSGGSRFPAPTSMSQPCLSVSNIGPTRILPFLYLGSQHDAHSPETMKVNGIGYVLNVSTSCPKPSFITDGHFLRIPVNDNYCDKLLPFFQDAFQFLDKVREASGSVIVHCLAGISRSPTLAIAYIMQYLSMSSEEAYKYVKDKRPTISPNFNFLGQLLEYEKHLKKQAAASAEGSAESSSTTTLLKKQCIEELRSPSSPTVATSKRVFTLQLQPHRETVAVQSPTTALAKLNFGSGHPSPVGEKPAQEISFSANNAGGGGGGGGGGIVVSPAVARDAADIAFPQFPTTALDKLSFTPCLVMEDSGMLRPASAKLSGANKRPLSTSALDNRGGHPAQHRPSGTSSADRTPADTSQTVITLRSPEMKAKRPLVRPNSIAFSSYPLFDFTSDSSSSSFSGVQTDLQRTRSPSVDGGMPEPRPFLSPGVGDRQLKYVDGLPVEMRPKDSMSSAAAAVNGEKRSSLEQARKSRSLEDILNSPENEHNDCGCPGVRQAVHRQHRQLQAADIFSQPMALDRVQCRCRGPSDPHQSSSSISSSGSHNSLHSSLEIIQVS